MKNSADGWGGGGEGGAGYVSGGGGSSLKSGRTQEHEIAISMGYTYRNTCSF